jgi:ribosome-binding factor A
MAREFSRNLRVGAELQRVLNDLLQAEVKDPRLDDVRVSEVALSGDLGVAKVYYGTLRPDDDRESVTAALEKANGFLRKCVGQQLRLRRVPELRFIHDSSAERGLQISRLIAGNRPTHDSEE